jgi:hypothetical protein
LLTRSTGKATKGWATINAFQFIESEPWINILNIREEKMKLNRRDVLVLVGSAATAILVAGRAQSATVETYYYLVFNNPVAGKEKEYLSWYDNRHIIDVTSIPGFVSGQRFIRNETQMYPNVEPRLANYLTLYKVRTDDLDAVNADITKRIQTGVTKFEKPSVIEADTGQGYWYRFNAPEIKRTMPLPADFAGKKLVNYDHIVFMNAVEGKQKELEEWYDHTHSPDMLTGAGIMTSQRTTLARPSGNTKPAATKEMVLFMVQMPEGLPANSAAPKIAPIGMPSPQDLKTTRGYTYRQIGPLVTHEHAVAQKATFKD